MSTGTKLAVGGAVLVFVPVLVVGAVSAASQKAAEPSTAAAAPVRSAAPTATRAATPPVVTSAPAAAPAAEPTFTYPGDPQCAITYRDAGGGAMVWTVATTVPGELITHASGADGTIYRHDEHIAAGEHGYRAPVPLAQITDIGGDLRGDSGTSYGCSVAPQR